MKIALCGSDGKMGQVFQSYFSSTYELVCVTHTSTCLNNIIEQVDLVVDFTNSVGALIHGVIALTHDVPIIIGSTGLSKQQLKTLRKIANTRDVACVVCNNFAQGIRWFNQQLPILHDMFSSAHISEAHHKSKVDRPSGTAIRMANLLEVDVNEIETVRDDSYHVRHKICFTNAFETLNIEHIVYNRYAYMKALENCIDDIYKIHSYIEW